MGLHKEGKEQELWKHFKNLMDLTKKEKGCIRAHATKQISHPGSPGKSKYTIVLLQEYMDVNAFDAHCAAEYVTNFFKDHIDNEKTALVAEWQCRLFSENE